MQVRFHPAPGTEDKAVIYFKSCPRCSGDLMTANEVPEAYSACLQCGFILYGSSRREAYATYRVQSQQPSPPSR